MKGKVVLLIALAIVLLSVSAANMGSATLSDNNVEVAVRPDGTQFMFETVYKSDTVYITKVTTIYPNGTSEVNWLKAWVNGGVIYCDEIPPPQ